jgi:hypothetical protein
MTSTDEATFIVLWNAGTETAAIARRLAIPRGTVSSRAYTLVRQGKIRARPRGGAYPKQQVLARSAAEGSEGTPAPPPRSTHTPTRGGTRPHPHATRGSISSSGPSGSPRP